MHTLRGHSYSFRKYFKCTVLHKKVIHHLEAMLPTHHHSCAFVQNHCSIIHQTPQKQFLFVGIQYPFSSCAADSCRSSALIRGLVRQNIGSGPNCRPVSGKSTTGTCVKVRMFTANLTVSSNNDAMAITTCTLRSVRKKSIHQLLELTLDKLDY